MIHVVMNKAMKKKKTYFDSYRSQYLSVLFAFLSRSKRSFTDVFYSFFWGGGGTVCRRLFLQKLDTALDHWKSSLTAGGPPYVFAVKYLLTYKTNQYLTPNT